MAVPREDAHPQCLANILNPQSHSTAAPDSEQPVDEAAPGFTDSYGSHDSHADAPGEIERVLLDPSAPLSTSQHTARPLFDVEKEAASTLGSLLPATIKPLTLLRVDDAIDGLNFPPVQANADSSAVRLTCDIAQPQHTSVDGDLVYMRSQKVPGERQILPQSQRRQEIYLRLPRIQHERTLVKESVPYVAASGATKTINANRTEENMRAAPSSRIPYGLRAKPLYSQRAPPRRCNGIQSIRSQIAATMAPSNTQKVHSREPNAEDYQAAAVALIGLRQSHALPPNVSHQPVPIRHASPQPLTSTKITTTRSGVMHPTRPINSHYQHHTQSDHGRGIVGVRSGLPQAHQPIPSRGSVHAQAITQYQHRILQALHRDPRASSNPTTRSVHDRRRIYRRGPYYASLPASFGALSLARGRNWTETPVITTGNTEPGIVDAAQDEPMTGVSTWAERVQSVSSAQRQEEDMNAWKTRHYTKWIVHGRASTDSGDLWADALPDLVLHPEDELSD